MYYSKKDVRPSFQRSWALYSLTGRLITQCWNSITLRRFHADRIWYENRQKPRAGALGWVVVAFEHLEDGETPIHAGPRCAPDPAHTGQAIGPAACGREGPAHGRDLRR